jgi:hypothetical protein
MRGRALARRVATTRGADARARTTVRRAPAEVMAEIAVAAGTGIEEVRRGHQR